MITIKQGLDIPIAGKPQQRVAAELTTKEYAVLGRDYLDIRPQLQVAEGDTVKKGQVLFCAKAHQQNVITAPVAGKIKAINLGARRRLASLVIERDDSIGHKQFKKYSNFSTITREDIKRILVESGEWGAFLTRPYGKIPLTDSEPAAIFVTAMDTNPLSVDAHVIISQYNDAFYDGLALLNKLND